VKKVKNTTGANEYKKVNKQIRKDMKRTKKKRIEKLCKEIEENLGKNNNKKAYKISKDLTQQKLSLETTIQDKNGFFLTDEKDITDIWTQYCSDLYNHKTQRDPNIIKSHDTSNIDNFPILREVVAAIRSLKMGKLLELTISRPN